ncbi:DivIVA domain-containing protein [Kocuria coralli]|uniref:Cell wall synthesis protein Wag31 n=1 Tax=Kocuria coralli TaxID=1461025 RepID=A0A5J5KXK9_9MICC|nr:DivIVA domain-containing protein [Kocuria coralli]KAA9393566.1 DivIVA domain-containing protein [Kocuria coralli]
MSPRTQDPQTDSSDRPDRPGRADRDERTGAGNDDGSRFPRVGSRAWGYAPETVDAFLADVEAALTSDGTSAEGALTSADVRAVVFGRARGGYEPQEVDTTLDRVEDALTEREIQAYVRDHGQEAWETRVNQLSELIFGRLERADGQRFRAPSGASTRGYAVGDVDELCRSLTDRLGRSRAVDPDSVRSAVFGPAVGGNAYEEQQVDAFLDKVVELLLALR